MLRRRLFFAVLASSVWVAGILAAGDAWADPLDRVSEIVPTATEAWEEPGFRIQLRFGSESLEADAPYDRRFGPDDGHFSLAVEPGVRLNRWWSVATSFRYTILSERRGLRWTGSADLLFHPFHGLHVGVGAGYGGMMGGVCDGSGVAFLSRTGWLFPLGVVFATGPSLQVDWQSTSCEGERSPLPLHHRSTNLSWVLAWR